MNHPQISSDQWKYLTAVLDHLATLDDGVSFNDDGGWDFSFTYESGGMYDDTAIHANCAGFDGVSYDSKSAAEDDWLAQVHLYYTDRDNSLAGWTVQSKYGKEDNNVVTVA
jgi:hypothetical protein